MEWRMRRVLLALTVLQACAASDVEANVSCALGSSCILPCSFQSEACTIIQWVYRTAAGPVNVLSFYDGEDHDGLQDLRFQGRTSLVEDPISGTAAALMLKGVTVQDGGEYKCYTSCDKRGFQACDVVLDVQRVGVARAGTSAMASTATDQGDIVMWSPAWVPGVVFRTFSVLGISVGGLVLLYGLWFLQRGIVNLVRPWMCHGEREEVSPLFVV